MENKKIAVIDDDVSLNKKLSNLLMSVGFSVYSAYTGIDGLELIRQEKPHLIILDITMPQMDGISMLRQLRSDESIKNTKVIVLSNISSGRVIRYTSELGVQDYLIKTNHNFSDVIERVNQYF